MLQLLLWYTGYSAIPSRWMEPAVMEAEMPTEMQRTKRSLLSTACSTWTQWGSVSTTDTWSSEVSCRFRHAGLGCRRQRPLSRCHRPTAELGHGDGHEKQARDSPTDLRWNNSTAPLSNKFVCTSKHYVLADLSKCVRHKASGTYPSLKCIWGINYNKETACSQN